MKALRIFLTLTVTLVLLASLASCAANPLKDYNAAVAASLKESSYRESIQMSATAMVESSVIRVGIESDLTCQGNTGATFAASGTGKATVSSIIDSETPYKLCVRDGVYYYDYENYFEDGSNYRYKLDGDFAENEVITDLFSIQVDDLRSAEVKKENGKTVIVMVVKDEKAATLLNDTLTPMDMMLFGETTVPTTLKDLTIVTTLDVEGRIEQCTATVLGNAAYYGSYVSIIYVYDILYSDYGTAPAPTFPDDLSSYPAAE